LGVLDERQVELIDFSLFNGYNYSDSAEDVLWAQWTELAVQSLFD
jgi:hypothetical protein